MGWDERLDGDVTVGSGNGDGNGDGTLRDRDAHQSSRGPRGKGNGEGMEGMRTGTDTGVHDWGTARGQGQTGAWAENAV